MKPIVQLVKLEDIHKLASRSNMRLGKAIAQDGQFENEKINPYVQQVKITHKSGQARTVKVESTPKGLRWKCSCSSRKNSFCQHCTALGLHIISENEI
jgi:hypothetical protein